MRVSYVLLVCVLVFAGCGDQSPKKEQKTKEKFTGEKLKPSENNTFYELMEKNGHNLNYILYGLLSNDAVKVKNGTENISLLCKLILKKLPQDILQDADKKRRWEKTYKEQGDIARKINSSFEESNYDGARHEMKGLLRNCMLCHREIKSIPKDELTFVGKLDPTMEIHLTEAMDTCNLNFGDLLFGLIANDMFELSSALKNIKRTSTLMMQKERIPIQLQQHKEKWDAHCVALRDITLEFDKKIKTGKDDEIWNMVETLLKVCMDCHSLYRPKG